MTFAELLSDSKTVIALLIFFVAYIFISLQKIHFLNLDRPSASLAGAVCMVLAGVLTLDESYRAINHDTLALLLGMMLVIAYLEQAGFFERTSYYILTHGGSPRRMLAWLVFTAGALSALFVNDTICLLFTPIVLATVLKAGLNPVPYLIALMTSANIGSVMMLTGNPQNMLIGISSDIPFGRFFLIMLPAGLVCLALNAAFLCWYFRKDLPDCVAIPEGEPPPVDAVVIRRIVGVVALMLVGFMTPVERLLPGLQSGQKLPLIAMVGGTLAILVGRFPPRVAMKQVDWALLLFFSGLFILFAGIEKRGILAWMHDGVTPLFGETPASQTVSFSLFSIAASNLVSNVPFVMVAREWIGSFAEPGLMWYVLSLTSTFAGNLTVVGSVANIIVLEQSREKAPIGFLDYLKVGVPVTILSTLAGLGVLWLMRWLGVAF